MKPECTSVDVFFLIRHACDSCPPTINNLTSFWRPKYKHITRYKLNLSKMDRMRKLQKIVGIPI
jgi:hypothetical protein